MVNDRETARFVLVNDLSEVLLVRYESPEPIDPTRPELLTFWVPPGGGLEPDESYETAAVREIYEETGLNIEISHCIWIREYPLKMSGVLRFVKERYFVARCAGRVINSSRHSDEGILAYRWWTIDELRSTAEIVRPPDLAALLDPILRNELPDRPIAIQGA